MTSSTLPKAVLLIISNDRPDGGNSHHLTPFNDGAPLRPAPDANALRSVGVHRFGCDKLIQQIAASVNASAIVMSREDLAGTS